MREGSVKEIPFVDPFTGIVSKETHPPFEEEEVDWNKREILGVDLDKETGETKVVVTGYQDIEKEIQEFKDQCGFEGMRALIAAGKARPLDFADDGKHSFDSSRLPDNVNDAYRAGLASANESSNLFASLGIKPVYDKNGNVDVAATEKLLTDTISQIFKDKAAAAATAVEEDKK